jgi:hypothetical protein
MSRKTAAPASRPFSIGYAYAQTQHYRDAVAAQHAAAPAPAAVEADPFDAIPAAAPTFVGPTEPMVSYALSLAARKMGPMTDETRKAVEDKVRATPKREVSKMIDDLKTLPDFVAPVVQAPAAPATAQVTEGMYRDPATGDIFKVQVAHHGSGRPYAKKLVALEEPRVKGKKTFSHEFTYVPGLIGRIQAAWKMTKEEAQEWGRLYGSCCKCGAILTDERSIAAGIGPVCGGSW